MYDFVTSNGIFFDNSFLTNGTKKRITNKLIITPNFIRGAWEGDGTFAKSKETLGYRASITSVSLNFINVLEKYLKKNGINYFITTIHNELKNPKHHTVYRLWINQNSLPNFINLIYNNPKLYMSRKYSRCLVVLNTAIIKNLVNFKQKDMINYISRICNFVIEQIDGEVETNKHNLLLATAITESNLKYRKQINGPALSYFQIEECVALDIIKYAKRKRLFSKILKISHINKITEKNIAYHLETNDIFSCAIARLIYKRVPKPVPDTLVDCAEYWKKYYNTAKGKGTVEKYVKSWKSFNLKEF